MKKIKTQEIYLTPDVKVKEIQARKVLCGSPTGATNEAIVIDVEEEGL